MHKKLPVEIGQGDWLWLRLINKDRERKLRNKADSASTIIIYTLGVLEPDQDLWTHIPTYETYHTQLDQQIKKIIVEHNKIQFRYWMQKILPIIFNSRGGGGAYLIQAHLRESLIGLGGLFNLERTMVSVLSIKN